MSNLKKNLLPLKVRILQQQELLRQDRLQRIKNNRFCSFHRELLDFIDRVNKRNFTDPFKYKFLFKFD